MLVKEFCELLEEKFNVGLWREIKVIPADPTKQKSIKKPIGEMSNMTPAQIVKSRSHPNLRNMGGMNAVLNYSIYLKHTPLYCIDFDTKQFKDPSFFQSLVDGNCYHTETAKGYHFFVRFENFPGEYQNEVNLASPTFFHKPDDIDLIKKKRNVWEPHDRVVLGDSFGVLDWNDVQQFFQPEKFNWTGNDVVIAEPVEADAVAPQGEDMALVMDNSQTPVCDVATMKMYLDRLSQERVDDYDSWVIISLIIHHNFRDNPIDGYRLYDEWSSKGASYNKKECRKKWDKLAKSDFKRRKATYKKIRGWADEDDPQNEFEQIYKEKSEEAMVKHMNENLIYKRDSSEFIVIHSCEALDFFIKDANKLKLDYENKCFLVQHNEKKNLVELNPLKLWRASKYRREVKRIDFDPRPTASKDIYNLWVKYYITMEEAKDTGYAENLMSHIRNVWCNDDEVVFNYVMNWLAWVIQKPERKIGVMLALKSKQGAGKGIVLSILQEIMDGDRKMGYFSQCSNTESVLGNYTYGIEGKCLLDFDEAYWGGDKKKEGQIKNLITESNQEIRKKFAHPYFIHNTTAFILTTNNLLFAGMTEDDRRHACCDVNDRIIMEMDDEQKEAYFNAISHSEYGKPAHPEVVRSFAHILYNRDITSYNPRKFPKTALAQNQITHGWASVTRFWFQVLDEERWCEQESNLGNDWVDYGQTPYDADYGLKIGEDVYLSKNWIYKTYHEKKLGGYSSVKDCKESFWTSTWNIFDKAIVERKIQRENTRGLYIGFPEMTVMRKAFRNHQRYYGKLWSDEGVQTLTV